MLKRNLLLNIIVFLYCGCTPGVTPEQAFYYWKTTYDTGPAENNALARPGVKSLYLRFFDVDHFPGTEGPVPRGRIQFNAALPAGKEIIPVIFITNRTFLSASDSIADYLPGRVWKLIKQTAAANKIKISEIQIDCDWTQATKKRYFKFLSNLNLLSRINISATIRLHQVKYRKETGVPPVSKGMLMYYNMGTIDASANNSIFDPAIAARYTGNLNEYPLPLDLALPIFGWGIQIRNGEVVQLLNKMERSDLAGDSGFATSADNRQIARHPGFHHGYYFQQGDAIKWETVTPEALLAVPEQLAKHGAGKFGKIVFYDLDAINLNRYEENFFERVAAGFR
ncbi:hypothetical protein [Flavihumibacter petaseus]|uniref:Uncharacterized protein n=1 Tax=Flavihumibacter petaseus NBRC 106054 TaxID=1220578 RepID=A0A0E9MUX4_9BACT|nr:hypothetical protein [Flavihumibacter petaseus]GAO41231.1 hypothetical protein FPE01S_01_02430 [Flavihumibacter petaseus NBRC 106054]